MVTAEVIDVERTTNITPQGEVEDALRPLFTLSPLSGTFRTESIPLSDYSREVAENRIREVARELVAEGEDVTVVFPEGTA